MKTTLTLIALGLILGWFSCTQKKQEKPTTRTIQYRVNISPQKVFLEKMDSLIINDKHRIALPLLDSFQRTTKDEIYRIQSENLVLEALDSLYEE